MLDESDDERASNDSLEKDFGKYIPCNCGLKDKYHDLEKRDLA